MPSITKSLKRERVRLKKQYGPRVHGKSLGLLYRDAVLKRYEAIKKKRAKVV